MTKTYYFLLAWIIFLSWTSAFMALWLLGYRRIEFGPGMSILIFSFIVGFFSLVLSMPPRPRP